MMKDLCRNFRIICLFVLCIVFTNCIPEGIELPNIYSVTTADVTNITVDGATLNGSFGIIDTEKTVACGVEYGTLPTSLSTNLPMDEITSDGDFSVNLTGLNPNTTYYYRAYAIDVGKYRYGETRSFTTKAKFAVTTGGATNRTVNKATLWGTISNSELSVTCGIIYGISSILSSTNGTIMTTASNGAYSISVTGLSANTVYYYCAYAIVDGEYKYGEICSFNTKFAASAIDLGLSVKWASFNVGAESPEDYGGYYAWGETEEKSNYAWSTYKWCNDGMDDRLTKYNSSSRYGTVDDKWVLDIEDDVAHTEWGEGWRMPSAGEISELFQECTWSLTVINGINGYKITGPSGNNIFLPAAGWRYDESISGMGTVGEYWSRGRSGMGYSDAGINYLYFRCNEDVKSWSINGYRKDGCTVRPVTDK